MADVTPTDLRNYAEQPPPVGLLYEAPPTLTPSVQLNPPPFRRPRGQVPRRKAARPTIAVRTQDGPLHVQEFVLQGWTRNAQELLQIIQHTQGWSARFYGSKPTVWTFRGILWDGAGDYDWNNRFLSFYEQHLKGSRAESIEFPAYVQFPGRLISGFVFNMTEQADVPHEQMVRFTLNMIAVSDEPVWVADYADAPSVITLDDITPRTPSLTDVLSPSTVVV